MKFNSTIFPGLCILEPEVFGDSRGYFLETFQLDNFEKNIGKTNFLQDNESKSARGVVRGLHFQAPPFAQAKIVRCISGSVYDVVVDLRKNSPTWMQWFGINLSGENKTQLFIPRGFAHGFSVLSEEAIFSYKVDNYYSPQHEAGIRFDDPALKIDWQLPAGVIQVSGKDRALPLISNCSLPDFEL